MKIGVIGAGFVGSSVINGFDTKRAEILVCDPKYNSVTIEELVYSQPSIIFICLPTPESKNGSVDVSIVEKVVYDLDGTGFDGIVVIKSTITPDHIERFDNSVGYRIVYNPEFLTEANAHDDFINPPMQILGGRWEDCEEVERIYVRYSKVKIVPTFKTDYKTASLLKYTINSFLATKVIFMNEIAALHKQIGAGSSWEQFTDMLSRDSRIGNSHLKVPGPDGEPGFGGHCFPKDTAGLLYFSNENKTELSILRQAVIKNKQIR
jgi:UDPglucose 6-dehydrogenase